MSEYTIQFDRAVELGKVRVTVLDDQEEIRHVGLSWRATAKRLALEMQHTSKLTTECARIPDLNRCIAELERENAELREVGRKVATLAERPGGQDIEFDGSRYVAVEPEYLDELADAGTQFLQAFDRQSADDTCQCDHGGLNQNAIAEALGASRSTCMKCGKPLGKSAKGGEKG